MNRLVEQIVAGTRLPPAFTIESTFDGAPAIVVIGRWPDATPGSSGTIQTASRVNVNIPDVPDKLAVRVIRDTIYQEVRRLWLHELHEWVTFDGEHHHEPHGPDGAFR